MTKTVTEIAGVRVEEATGYVRCIHLESLLEFTLRDDDASKWKAIRDGAEAMGAIEQFVLHSIASLGKIIH